MIRFQDVVEDPQMLENQIAEQLDLVRALANFHVDPQAPDAPDLQNQRAQLLTHVKKVQTQFHRFAETWRQFSADLAAHIEYDPEKDTHADLITRFIRLVVPKQMQHRWDPEAFTGSLLVFFRDGKVESSSLIEKKAEAEPRPEVESSNGHTEDRDRIHVVDEPFNSFTVLKATDGNRFNVYFSLAEATRVYLIVYDEFEKLVRQIEAEFDRPGDYTLVWDGCDAHGQPVPKGRYYFQLQIGGALSEIKSVELA